MSVLSPAAGLGTCIKNNAAANIFNKDLDGRNYGVSRILKVHLFDYDAVEPLTDIKVRTNTTRIEARRTFPTGTSRPALSSCPRR